MLVVREVEEDDLMGEVRWTCELSSDDTKVEGKVVFEEDEAHGLDQPVELSINSMVGLIVLVP